MNRNDRVSPLLIGRCPGQQDAYPLEAVERLSPVKYLVRPWEEKSIARMLDEGLWVQGFGLHHE